jgi:ribose-phosphate pyrophosphokinase
MSERRLLFSTECYEYLKRELLAKDPELEEGKLEIKHFPDGERYVRIETPVEGRDIVVLGGTVSDTDALQIYDLGCALSKYGATKITFIVPYYGYSTMERAVKPGEIVTAKTRARLLSLIPEATHGNHFIFLDLHSEGLPHYFEGCSVTKHLYAKCVIIDAIRHQMKDTEFVLASTDAGRAKWVESLANEMHVGASFVLKRRISGDKTELAAVAAHVEGKHVCVYDDMIRTGGSLITAAKAYMDAGAKSISAYATHGVLPGDSLERLRYSNLFQHIVCTNSHPRAVQLEGDFLRVTSIADILVAGLATGF